ncbi:uncharacterized protein BO72DRAFT_230418 [Aspergillus fijiensis CBS 313.89]|uniref:Uncharacterized protein n=1 Tax=Aspergillus fijiensis CBS 313.89 TaxID=1448319 RepID=A0A8G1VV25_9EURO|nr:uncharacterized protein BO72DRAFT_230418 [Aspergillus fijiensis CBS 313.89]RAK73667.1 hypothetical protein BO72DRAFT_230418 [Aspergillus fijiensis CBS 313.89]
MFPNLIRSLQRIRWESKACDRPSETPTHEHAKLQSGRPMRGREYWDRMLERIDFLGRRRKWRLPSIANVPNHCRDRIHYCLVVRMSVMVYCVLAAGGWDQDLSGSLRRASTI